MPNRMARVYDASAGRAVAASGASVAPAPARGRPRPRHGRWGATLEAHQHDPAEDQAPPRICTGPIASPMQDPTTIGREDHLGEAEERREPRAEQADDWMPAT